jgi:hypothetical protein
MLSKKMFKLVIKNGMVRFSWPEEVTLTEVYKAFSFIKLKKEKILALCSKSNRRKSRHMRILGTKLNFADAVASGCLLVEWIDDNLDEDAIWILHPDWDYSKRTTTPWIPISVFVAAISKVTPIGVTGDELSGHFTYD